MKSTNKNLIGMFQKAVNELIIDGDFDDAKNKIKPGHMIYVKIYNEEDDSYNVLNFSTSYAGTPIVLKSCQLVHVLGIENI